MDRVEPKERLLCQHGQVCRRGLVGHHDGAGRFGCSLARIRFCIHNLRGGAAAGHEQTAPVILKLAGRHTDVSLQERFLSFARFRDNDNDAGVTEVYTLPQENGFDRIGIDRLAFEANVTRQGRSGGEDRTDREGGGQEEKTKR